MRRLFSQRTAIVVGVASLGVLAFLALEIWERRLELFVIPARFDRVLELRETFERTPEQKRDALGGELAEAIRDLVEIQRPDLIRWPGVAIVPLRGLEGESWWAITFQPGEFPLDQSPYYSRGMGGRGCLVVDSRGRLVGEPFRCEYLHDHDGWDLVRDPGVTFDVLRYTGCFDVAVDALGPVPVGFNSGWSRDDTPITGAVPASTGNSKNATAWFERIEWIDDATNDWPAPPPSLERAHAWLESDRLGDRYRGLHALEQLGPTYARLALPLTRSRDERLRARAVAVAANDRSLGGRLRGFLDDPSPTVRDAAAWALFYTDDIDVARRAFVQHLGRDGLLLLHADQSDDAGVGCERLSCPEVVDAVLRRISRKGPFVNGETDILAELDAIHLEPHADELLSLWKAHSDEAGFAKGLASCIARLEHPLAIETTRELLSSESLGLPRAVLTSLLRRRSPAEALVPALRALSVKREPFLEFDPRDYAELAPRLIALVLGGTYDSATLALALARKPGRTVDEFLAELIANATLWPPEWTPDDNRTTADRFLRFLSLVEARRPPNRKSGLVAALEGLSTIDDEAVSLAARACLYSWQTPGAFELLVSRLRTIGDRSFTRSERFFRDEQVLRAVLDDPRYVVDRESAADEPLPSVAAFNTVEALLGTSIAIPRSLVPSIERIWSEFPHSRIGYRALLCLACARLDDERTNRAMRDRLVRELVSPDFDRIREQDWRENTEGLFISPRPAIKELVVELFERILRPSEDEPRIAWHRAGLFAMALDAALCDRPLEPSPELKRTVAFAALQSDEDTVLRARTVLALWGELSPGEFAALTRRDRLRTRALTILGRLSTLLREVIGRAGKGGSSREPEFAPLLERFDTLREVLR